MVYALSATLHPVHFRYVRLPAYLSCRDGETLGITDDRRDFLQRHAEQRAVLVERERPHVPAAQHQQLKCVENPRGGILGTLLEECERVIAIGSSTTIKSAG